MPRVIHPGKFSGSSAARWVQLRRDSARRVNGKFTEGRRGVVLTHIDFFNFFPYLVKSACGFMGVTVSSHFLLWGPSTVPVWYLYG